MSKYITKSGQNLYDIALTLYGSIEGIFDLLISNSDISFNTVFSTGTELEYHENFIINQDIPSWFDNNNIKVKNGKYDLNDKDVRSEIVEWLTNNNTAVFEKYSTGELSITTDSEDEAPNAYDWDISTPAVVTKAMSSVAISNTTNVQFGTQGNWTSQSIDASTSSTTLTDAISFIKAASNIKLESLSQSELSDNLNTMFSNGMIVIPTNDEEKEKYYDSMAKSKILIQQTGKSSIISMQIPSNSFVAINWGDDTGLDFYHYKKNTINATHTYNDFEEHTIIVYGDNKFTNLDFTKINGIYYALSEIYVSNEFISLYPNATTLNKLFIKKTV